MDQLKAETPGGTFDSRLRNLEASLGLGIGAEDAGTSTSGGGMGSRSDGASLLSRVENLEGMRRRPVRWPSVRACVCACVRA